MTSSRKYRCRLATLDTTDGPSGQIVVWVNGAFVTPGEIELPTLKSRSRSPGRPWPCEIRYSTFSIQPAPSRHGVHLPQLSWAKNFASRHATSAGSVVSS